MHDVRRSELDQGKLLHPVAFWHEKNESITNAPKKFPFSRNEKTGNQSQEG